MRLFDFETIPTGRKALVTSPDGTVATIEGPRKIWVGFGTKVVLFAQYVIPEREAYAVTDEAGNVAMIEGPAVVDIHPQGKHEQLKTHSLAPQEAVVVRKADGTRIIYVGTGVDIPTQAQGELMLEKVARAQLKPGEETHRFKWTGSKGDTEEKSPGSLQISVLRLQETQSWFAVKVRTADNIMIQLNLMLFFTFTDVRKLVVNDDPLGVMFNRINAALLKAIGELKFDEFRKKPANVVEAAAKLAGEDEKALAALGLQVNNAILRLWQPTDQTVERLMGQEGTAIAQQAVEDANHEARLKKIANETAELDAATVNVALKLAAAKAAGTQEAARLLAIYEGLKASAGESSARVALNLAVLTGAAADGRLTITSEALRE